MIVSICLRFRGFSGFFIARNSRFFQCVIFPICSIISVFIFFFLRFFILLRFVMNIVLASALILEFWITLLFKRIPTFWYFWNFALLFLFQVRLNFSRYFRFEILLFLRNSLFYDLKFCCWLVGTFNWLNRLRIKHFIKFFLTSHLLTNLHLVQSGWLDSYKLILFTCLNSLQIVSLLIFACLLLKAFVFFFSLNSQQSVSSSLLWPSIIFLPLSSSFLRLFSDLIVLDFSSLDWTFLLLFDLRNYFEIMDTCSVVILIWTCKELFESFSVLICSWLILLFLIFFFFLIGNSVFFSFDSLKFLKLQSSFSSLFGKSLLEGLFLFFLMESFHGFGESDGSIFIELKFFSFFLLFFYEILFLFEGG